MFRHLLPNAMVATLTFLPFILSSSVMTLTALDFLGFGLPPGSPSLGELLSQGKANIQAPWLGLAGFFTVAIMLSLLIFIGEAVRDAFDPRKIFAMSASNRISSAVRDLSVAFRHGARETLAVDRVSFDIAKGETVALVGESGSGKSVTALSVMKLLPYPSAHHPSGTIIFKGQDCSRCREAQIRNVRGNDITIVFQEPMTSLNPLHTIEKQIGEILLLHQRLTRRGGAQRASSNCSTRSASPIPRSGWQLSAPAFRRPAPARDDRDGARQRARPADRRRADHRARRHRAGADPEAAEGPAEAGSACRMLFITHDLGIVRKIADRVCVMKRGQDRRAGPGRAGLYRARASLYARAARRRAEAATRRRRSPDAPVVIETDDLKVWFPIKRGVLRKVVGHIKAVDGVSIEVRQGETLGVVGESGSGKTTLGLAILRLISSQGPIVFMGNAMQGLKFKEMRPFRRDMQIVFQDPYGSLSPRMSVSDIIEEGLWVHQPQLSRERARAARRRAR